MEIDEKVKAFLFARWMATCYSDRDLNESNGNWWAERLSHFERVVLVNYIENGTYLNTLVFLKEKEE